MCISLIPAVFSHFFGVSESFLAALTVLFPPGLLIGNTFFSLRNLLRERETGRQRGRSHHRVKRKRETDPEVIGDVLYSLPINLPHQKAEMSPPVCGCRRHHHHSPEPSRVELRGRFNTIWEHLVRWRATLVLKPQNTEQYTVPRLSH